jgi:hypothetical protein
MKQVLIKLTVLNTLYKTSILDISKMAEHIIKLANEKDLNTRLRDGKPEAVEFLAKGHGFKKGKKGKEYHFYSFATKYCHWSNPEGFPIYDSYVVSALKQLKKDGYVEKFIEKQLRDFTEFKRIIDGLMKEMGFPSYKRIDQGL